DAPINTLVQVRQHYMKHVASCDGEKYLHIRFYERKQDAASAIKWRKLLDTKMKSLNQILRNEWLCLVLDKLEPFRSLWIGFQLGSFPLILSWRCSQVQNYLCQMQSMWNRMTGGSGVLCDENTVTKLEGLAPQWSSRDRSLIEAFFSENQVFCRVNDPALRAVIQQRVLAVEGCILSFKTFFEDVKVLGPVMLRLRELFPPSDLVPPRGLFEPLKRRSPSIRDVLLQKYRKGLNAERCVLQYDEDDERRIEAPDPAMYSYWQLCLFLFRHQRGDWKPLKKARNQHPLLEHPEWLINLSHCARRLGFESDRISILCHQDPDLSQIRTHMREEKPSSHYSVSLEEFDLEAHTRQQRQAIFKRRALPPTPLMTTDTSTLSGKIRTHIGLFLPAIWSALEQEARYALTDFGRLVLILTSFFGDFGPRHTPLAREEPETEVSNQQLLLLPRASNPTPRSLSVYSLPDASPAEPVFTSRNQDITFWHLPASRRMDPTREYRC
ncbi:hypothetical protein CC86DRAFT_243071, partial [Ophiobolus disseminans]